MATNFFEHPDYKATSVHWQRYGDFYRGDHDTLVSNSNYLIPHFIEERNDNASKQLYAMRKERTRFLAVPEIIVSLWQSLFFRESAELDAQDLKLLTEDGAANVDGKKTSFNDYLKDYVLRDLLVYGKPITLVDAHRAEFVSLKEQKESKFRPFLVQINPLDLKDWELETESTERYGRYNFARYEYAYIPRRGSASEEPKEEMRTSVLSLNNKKYQIEVFRRTQDKTSTPGGWEPVGDKIESNLKEIPLISISEESWIKDVCEEMHRHLNIRSAKDNTLGIQGYQRLWAKGITNPDQIKALSSHVITILPPDGEMGAIEPTSTEAYERAEAEAINNAFKVGLNMLRQLPSDSRLTQAEGTQSEEKKNTYALVESTLTQLENFGRDIINTWAAFLGNENYKSNFTLNKEVDDEDMQEFITIYQAFRDDFVKVPKAHKEIVKKALKKMNLSDDTMEAAYKAIDSAPLETPQQPTNELDTFLGKQPTQTTP